GFHVTGVQTCALPIYPSVAGVDEPVAHQPDERRPVEDRGDTRQGPGAQGRLIGHTTWARKGSVSPGVQYHTHGGPAGVPLSATQRSTRRRRSRIPDSSPRCQADAAVPPGRIVARRGGTTCGPSRGSPTSISPRSPIDRKRTKGGPAVGTRAAATALRTRRM